MKDPEFTDAIVRYQEHRRLAREDVQRSLQARFPGLRLTEIRPQDVAVATSNWFGSNNPHHDWDFTWEDIVEVYAKHKVRRFDLAIHRSSTLCGLAIGKTSKRANRIYIDIIEGNPCPNHPLKGFVTEVVATVAIAFGKRVGAHEVRIMQPARAVVPHYQKYGFTYMFVPPYYSKPRDYLFVKLAA